jgi:S-adenosylmethionine decarboxylase
MKQFWGYHLMVDCSKCNKEKVKDLAHIKKFINSVVKTCKMKKLGDLKVENLQSGNKKLYGYSVVQLIHTSSIVCHLMDESGDVYIDIFSCKEFNVDNVIDIINKYFSPKKMNKHFLLRDAHI